MARKIIIQERINEPSDFSFRYVLWADVPAARQSFYADPAKTSSVKDATASELVALRTGAVLEQSDTAFFPAGTTAAVIRTALIARFTTFQDRVTAENPWRFYGTSADFVSGAWVWTAGGAV